MTPECKAKVEAHLSQVRGAKVTLSAEEARKIDKAINQSARDLRAQDVAKWRGMTAEERTAAAGVHAASALERKADAAALAKMWQTRLRVQARDDMIKMAQTGQKEGGTATTGTLREKEHQYPHTAALMRMMEQTARQKGGAVAAVHGQLSDIWGDLKSKFSRMPYMDAPEAQGLMGMIFREMRGEATNSTEAKTAAAQITNMMNDLRQRLNAFGANIGEMKDFVPQDHNGRLVLNAGKDTWTEDVFQRIDKSDFLDSNGDQMADADIRATLGDMWETITSNGRSKKDYNVQAAQVEGPLGARSVMERASSFSRKINFKDAAAHESYHAKYSELTPVGLLLQHLTRSAEDLAVVERFGPDAMQNIQKLTDVAHQLDDEVARGMSAQGKKALMEPGKRTVAGINPKQLAESLLGHDDDYHSVVVDVARWFTSMHAGTKLTRTTLRAVPQDINTVVSYAAELGQMHNLPTMVKAATDGQTRKELMRMGVGAGVIEQSLNNVGRRINVQTDGIGKKIGALGISGMNRVAYTTAHLTGLQAWTNSAGRVGQLIHGSHFAEIAGKEWGALKQGSKQLLSEVGINETNWNNVRRIPLMDVGGVKLPDIGRIGDLNLPAYEHNEMSRLVQGFLWEGQNKITNERDLLGRTAVSLGAKPGTGASAVVNSLMLFRGVVSVITANMIRRWKRQETGWGKTKVMSGYVIGATMAGYVGNQLVNLADGKDLQDANDLRTWGAAFTTGGGAGFLGDMIAGGVGQVNPTGGASNAWRFLGPTGSEIGDVFDIGRATVKTLMGNEKQEGEAGYKALRFARNHVPVANLWWSKLAIDRLFMDDVNEAVMPGYSDKMQGLAEKYGGSYWWKPGDTSPEQAPGQTNARDSGALPIFK